MRKHGSAFSVPASAVPTGRMLRGQRIKDETCIQLIQALFIHLI